MLSLCWVASSLYPELALAFWLRLTLTTHTLLFKECVHILGTLVLEWSVAFARRHSFHSGKGSGLVPRCPCFRVQLFSVPENAFPQVHTWDSLFPPSASFILFLALFSWIGLLSHGCLLWKKKTHYLVDFSVLWGQGLYETK